MHDAVKLESAGIPVAVIIEEGFKELAYAKRRLMGLEALTPVIIAGHLGSHEMARQQGEKALSAVVEWVLQGNKAPERVLRGSKVAQAGAASAAAR